MAQHPSRDGRVVAGARAGAPRCSGARAGLRARRPGSWLPLGSVAQLYLHGAGGIGSGWPAVHDDGVPCACRYSILPIDSRFDLGDTQAAPVGYVIDRSR